MSAGFESGALLGHIYTVGEGVPVRLRLAQSGDITAIRKLVEQAPQAPPRLDLGRLVHFDPRRRYVVCATGLIDGTETLLGLGAISLDAGARPELLVVGERHGEELMALLTRALTSAARTLGRPRAA
jgi:hypothetical protein